MITDALITDASIDSASINSAFMQDARMLPPLAGRNHWYALGRTLCVLLTFVTLAVTASSLWAAPPPPSLQPATDLDMVLQKAGIFEQIAQLTERVDAELRNLQASPLFTAGEIARVREHLVKLREEALYRQLTTAIEQQFTPDELAALQRLTEQPALRFLLHEEHALQTPSQQEQVRLYQLRTREAQPATARVDWLLALDRARYNTRFETELKVALRKSVLASVSMVKTQQPLAEAALDHELSSYRQKLNNELSEHALYTYLYLFRKTPTDAVQATVAAFQDPLYQRLMIACEEALQHSFRIARERNEEAARIAQVNTL